MTAVDQRLTADEEAILRSWLAGNDVKGIAKGRRVDQAHVVTILTDLCGLDRVRGRKALDAGTRPAAARTAADREVRERLEGEIGRLRHAYDAALTDIEQLRGQLDELAADARAAAEARDRALAELHTRPTPPVPLTEYHALRCPACGWVGYDETHHPHQPLMPVTVAILPRTA